MLAGSTLHTLHALAGEERHPRNRLWTWALQLQSAVDPSLWYRHVDIALVGGDPLTLARRMRSIARLSRIDSPVRIAVIHDGLFSGAPLAAIQDMSLGRELGFLPETETPGDMEVGDFIASQVRRSVAMLGTAGVRGVLAFDPVQGLFDPARGEMVLRLARERGFARQKGLRPSTRIRTVLAPSSGPGGDLFQRSRTIFDRTIRVLHAELGSCLEEPPGGQRFADVIVARRVELLSGFISPPLPAVGSFPPTPFLQPYRFAGLPPRRVAEALDFFRDDFRRAATDPIFPA